jgi:hypothetical protein
MQRLQCLVRSLAHHIQRYIEGWSKHPTPFVWTKEPVDIIKKPLRHGR